MSLVVAATIVIGVEFVAELFVSFFSLSPSPDSDTDDDDGCGGNRSVVDEVR